MGAYLTFLFRENPPAATFDGAPFPQPTAILHPNNVQFTPMQPFVKDGTGKRDTISRTWSAQTADSALTSSQLPPTIGYSQPPSGNAPSGVTDVLHRIVSYFPPGFFKKAALSTVGFMGLHALCPRVLPKIIPGYTSLTTDTQNKFVYYISSMAHHLVVAPLATQFLWQEYKEGVAKGPRHRIDYSPSMDLAAFSSGYFIADFIGTLDQVFTNPDFFLHHLAAMALIVKGVDIRLTRFVPHFLICEWSTIFLDVLWILKQFGMEASPVYQLSAVGFVVLFTLTRIVNLPVLMYAAFTKHKKDLDAVLGRVKWVLPAVTALQFYWWHKILRQFAPLFKAAMTAAASLLRRGALWA
jgi:hypothetical protein